MRQTRSTTINSNVLNSPKIYLIHFLFPNQFNEIIFTYINSAEFWVCVEYLNGHCFPIEPAAPITRKEQLLIRLSNVFECSIRHQRPVLHFYQLAVKYPFITPNQKH